MPKIPQTDQPASALPPQHLSSRRAEHRRAPTDAQTRTILLVDDHAMIRQGLCEIFHTLPGLQVTMEASNAEEAHEHLCSGSPDLVITDLVLFEGPDGIQLTKAIKARRHDLPVLLLSGHDEALFAERALGAGASGFVMKDVDLETLYEAIEAALCGRIWVSDDMRRRLLPDPVRARDPSQVLPADLLSQIRRGNHTVLGISRALRRSMRAIEASLDRAQHALRLPSRVSLLLCATDPGRRAR